MANIFDKIADIFKPNTEKIQSVIDSGKVSTSGTAFTPFGSGANSGSSGAASTASRPSTTGGFGPVNSTGRNNNSTLRNDFLKKHDVPSVSTPELPSFGSAVKKVTDLSGARNNLSFGLASKKEDNPLVITPRGKLSQRAYQNGLSAGENYEDISDDRKIKIQTYYDTLDSARYTNMYDNLAEHLGPQSESRNYGGDFETLYAKDMQIIESDLKKAAREHGKDSAEYYAMSQIKRDFEDLAIKITAKDTRRDAREVSSQLDDSINVIFGGVINSPDYAAEVEAGKEMLEQSSKDQRWFNKNLEGASATQRDLLLYTYSKDGMAGVKEIFNDYMGDSINYVSASRDFATDISDAPTKFDRALAAAKANLGSALDGQQLGGWLQTADSFKTEEDSDALVGEYTVADAMDNVIKNSLGEYADDPEFQTRGAMNFDSLGFYDIGGWYNEAKQNATPLQKQYLGAVLEATGGDLAAVEQAWAELESMGQAYKNEVRGTDTLATRESTLEGQLYRDYLGLSGKQAPEWLGNNGGDEDLTVAQFVWDAAETTAAQLPQIAASIAGAYLGGPMVARILGGAVMATPAYGNAYKQALDEGKTREQAIGYAATEAASEFATNVLLSGIAPIAGSLTGGAGEKLVKNIASPFVRALTDTGVRMVGEGAEEYIQAVAEPLIRNLWFDESNEVLTAENLAGDEAIYNFFLGAMSAGFMSGANRDIATRINQAKLGKALNAQNSTLKIVDTILENPVTEGSKEAVDAYKEAQKIAQGIKDGKFDANDVNVGEMTKQFAAAGGDLNFLKDPKTVAYSKETLTEDSLIAGATSMLAELGSDASLAKAVVKQYNGAQLTSEEQAAVDADPNAATVLAQLQAPLNLEENNALTRAVKSTVFKDAVGTAMVYRTLQNENPDKTVLSPAAQYLVSQGMTLKKATAISTVYDKVVNGEQITLAEAKQITPNLPAVRAMLLELGDIDLSEYANSQMVMDALNAKAAANAKIKDMQAGVKEGATALAKARASAPVGGIVNAEEIVGDVGRRDSGLAGGDRRGEREVDSGESRGVSGRTGSNRAEQQDASHTSRTGQQSRTGSGRNGRATQNLSRESDPREGEAQGEVISPENLTEEQRELQRALAKRGFGSVRFVRSGDSRKVWDPNLQAWAVYIRVGGQFSQDQYADHETLHLWLEAFTKKQKQAIYKKVKEALFGENYDRVYEQVKKLLNDKGILSKMSAKRASDYVKEELFCFAYAGQNYSENRNPNKLVDFDFSQLKADARTLVRAMGIEAMGLGDMSNPVVKANVESGNFNREYFERQEFIEPEGEETNILSMPKPKKAELKSEPKSEPKKKKQAPKKAAPKKEETPAGKAFKPSKAKSVTREEYNARYTEYRKARAENEAQIKAAAEELRAPGANTDEIILRMAELTKEAGELAAEGESLLVIKNQLEETEQSEAKGEAKGKKPEDAGKAFVPNADTEAPAGRIRARVIRNSLKEIKKDTDAKFVELTKELDKHSKETEEGLTERKKLLDNYKRYLSGVAQNLEKLEADSLRVKGNSTVGQEVRKLRVDTVQAQLKVLHQLNDTIPEDAVSYSADDIDDEYNTLGWVMPDGATAMFTDNDMGLHEELMFKLQGVDADSIYDVIEQGGIRCKPGYGVELSGNVEPTAKQYDILTKLINHFNGKTFYVDFTVDGAPMSGSSFTGAEIDPRRITRYLEGFYARRRNESRGDNFTIWASKILEMRVKSPEDARNMAQFLMTAPFASAEEKAQYQQIIDRYNAMQSTRFSSDDINLDLNDYTSDFYPDLDQNMFDRAVRDNMGYRDLYEREFEEGEEASDNNLYEDITGAQLDALLAELEAFPERAPEIFEKIQELQESSFNETKATEKEEPKKEEAPKKEAPKDEAPKKRASRKKRDTSANDVFKPKPVAQETEVAAENSPTPEPQTTALANVFKPAATGQATPEVETQKAEKKTSEKARVIFKGDDVTPSKKNGEWWKRIGKATSGQIRRLRSDRNTYQIMFADAKGYNVVFDEVSPSMLEKAFASALGSRELGKERAQMVMSLAQEASEEWTSYENPPVEKTAPETKQKAEAVRGRDNYGRKVPAKMTERMANSVVRDENGALLNLYRLAGASGVRNARIPGKYTIWVERPAVLNLYRGLSGAAAYGQSGKNSGDKISGWLEKLKDPNLSKAEVNKIRSQIAKEERKMKEYTSGVTRLDPFREAFSRPLKEDIVNGKTVLEGYLDIRNPLVIDAEGRGMQYLESVVQSYVNDPDNMTDAVDENGNPVGQYDGIKFINANLVPEGESLGGGNLDLVDVWIPFRSNQAKSTYNTAPTDSDLIQYSVDDATSTDIYPTDLDGNELSKETQKYFKGSISINANGDPVYAVTPLYLASDRLGYMAYDPEKTDAKCIFLTDSLSVGQTYDPYGNKVVDLVEHEDLLRDVAKKLKVSLEDLPLVGELRTIIQRSDRLVDPKEKRDAINQYARMYNAAVSVLGKGDGQKLVQYLPISIKDGRYLPEFVTKDGQYLDFDALAETLPSSGTWSVYAKTTNPLIIDGTGVDGEPSMWDEIDMSEDAEYLSWVESRTDEFDIEDIYFANTRSLAQYARELGYDSLIIKNIYDAADGELDVSNIYVVYEPNQIKSTGNANPTIDARMNYSVDDSFDTGYTEGTLEDTIIKILRDKDEDRALAALSEYMAQFLQTGVLPEIETAKVENIFQRRITPSEQKIIREQLDDLVGSYGAIPAGEKAARDVQFPARNDDGYIRRVFRTAAEAKNTPSSVVPNIERTVLTDEAATYQRITDKAAIAYADREMRKKGFDALRAEWQGKIDADVAPTKNDVAVGELLFLEAAKAGDMEAAMTTLSQLAEVGTTAGQVVQAFRMLKKMPRSYQLYYFQRVINRLNRGFAKRISSGQMNELKIAPQYAKAVLRAKNQQEQDAAIDALIDHIASQIPATLADKWNAWRYLAMLGNPKTHIRNLFGNAIFVPAKFAKDIVAAGLETTFIKDPAQRRTSLAGVMGRGNPKYRQIAEADFEGIKEELTSGGKYNPSSRILEARRIFNTPLLEKLRIFNSEKLEGEDAYFLKYHYVRAFTNYLTTRGLDPDVLYGTKEGKKVINAARQYAADEARKATYRDASKVATALNELKKVKGLGIIVEGMLPFTKTPINILARGIDYSPVGLVLTLTDKLNKLKKGDIDANEFIDQMAAGLTGTGITLLGVFLASLGILRGGEDDDEKQDEFDKLQGYQNYSITVGGVNYTIDWTAPVALPLFVGCELFKEFQEDGGLSNADWLNIMTVIAEPITSLSMLSGLNDALTSAKWDDNPLSSLLMTMATGYIGQGVPTLGAQISRSLVENRRTTYIDKNSDVSPAIQRWWQTTIMGKTPLNANRAEYIDAWGRHDTTKNFFVRVFENMLSPGYINRVNTTSVDAELQKLADSVGHNVLMGAPDRTIEFDNTTHNLTAEQYATYAKTRGDATMVMLDSLFNSDVYQYDLSDAEKAKAVANLKEYANVLGKQSVFPEYQPDSDNWAEKCDGDMERVINMAVLKAQASANGITSGNNGQFYSMIVNSGWLGVTGQAYAIAQQYSTTSKTVYTRRGGPTYEVTPERRDLMYQYYRTVFPEYYYNLVATDRWWNSDNETRLELLSDVRTEAGNASKAWLANYLYEIGAPTYVAE